MYLGHRENSNHYVWRLAQVDGVVLLNKNAIKTKATGGVE